MCETHVSSSYTMPVWDILHKLCVWSIRGYQHFLTVITAHLVKCCDISATSKTKQGNEKWQTRDCAPYRTSCENSMMIRPPSKNQELVIANCVRAKKELKTRRQNPLKRAITNVFLSLCPSRAHNSVPYVPVSMNLPIVNSDTTFEPDIYSSLFLDY